jgi:hypothetical protein
MPTAAELAALAAETGRRSEVLLMLSRLSRVIWKSQFLARRSPTPVRVIS